MANLFHSITYWTKTFKPLPRICAWAFHPLFPSIHLSPHILPSRPPCTLLGPGTEAFLERTYLRCSTVCNSSTELTRVSTKSSACLTLRPVSSNHTTVFWPGHFPAIIGHTVKYRVSDLSLSRPSNPSSNNLRLFLIGCWCFHLIQLQPP